MAAAKFGRRIAAFAASRGVTPQNAAVFLVAHETLGLALLVGSVPIAYQLEPSRRSASALMLALPPSPAEWSERMVARGEASATRLKQSATVRWIEEAGVFADPVRLGAALVETIVLRKLLAPVLVPLKLMVALRFAQRWSRRRRVRG